MTLLEIISLVSLLTPAVSSAALESSGNPSTHPHGTHPDGGATRHILTKKDASGARFTYYQVGQGACGSTNNPNDFVVALNGDNWDGGSHCYATITVSYQGKSAQAQIVDQCAGCPSGGLDMSQGLFSYFANTDEGMIYGDWVYGSGSPAPRASPPPQAQAPAPPTPSTQSLPAAYAELPQPTTSAQPVLLPTTTQTQVIEQETVTAPDGSVSTSTSILNLRPNANRTLVLASSTSTKLVGATQVLLVSGSASLANHTDTPGSQRNATATSQQPEETGSDEDENVLSESPELFQAGAQTHNLPFLSAANKNLQAVNFVSVVFALSALWWHF